MATTVDVTKCNNIEVAIRQYKRGCERAGLLKRLRELEHHVTQTEMNRRDRAAAVKRHAKQRQKERETMYRMMNRFRKKQHRHIQKVQDLSE